MLVNYERWEDGVLVEIIYDDPIYRSENGYNLILEDSYTFAQKYKLGLKVFLNTLWSYSTVQSSGIMLKFGINI